MSSPPGITLEVSAVPVLSYAMAHNRIAVVSRIQLSNAGPDLRAAVVRVQVRNATGSLGAPCDLLADVPAGGVAVLTDIGAPLDPALMSRVEEQRPGAVIVQVLIAGEVVAEHRTDVQVLAAQQWLAVPTSLGLEMLASFVMPNHPAVTALLLTAAQRLQRETGSGSVQGYQAGAERVDAIAAALFETMAEAGIFYVNPPASWTDTGQKVRTPAEVLDGHTGTCLDTTLVLAAAFEQAGLHPQLWITTSHAFLGYWRDEQSLPATAMTDVAGIVNLVDLDLIRLVETTMVTEQTPQPTFAQACAAPLRQHLAGDLADVVGVVDIRQARRDAIIPLPAQTRDPDGTVRITTYSPETHGGPAPTTPGAAPGPTAAPGSTGPTAPTAPTAPVRIGQWKNALLDMSLRNRLINYTARGSIGLSVPAGLLAAVEDTVNSGGAVTLLPADQVADVQARRGIRFGRDLTAEQRAELFTSRRALYTDVTAAGYDTTLRRVSYKARTVIEETGANNLYLALGTLVWNLDGRDLRSPLVLVPVRLTTRSRQGAYRLEVDEAGTSTPNYCLLEKLRQVHGFAVPGLAEPAEDAAGIDLDAAFRALRTALAQAGLNYRVEQTADLTILAFAKFRLWKDLDESWPELARNPLVAHLVNAPNDPFADPVPAPAGVDLDDLAGRCPAPADASQLDAIAEAVAGRTFVLEGPPGTGKSQTITNLLTRAVASGRRVLFVAEKRAALDVVTRRLDAAGMGPLCLDLHDKSAKPAVVRARIRAALDLRVSDDEQGLAVVAEQLRSATGQLSRYARRLHECNDAGLSVYSAHTALLAIGDADALPIPAPLLADGSQVARLRTQLTTLVDVADPAGPRPDHPWAFLDPAAAADPAVCDPAGIEAAAREVDRALASRLEGADVSAVLSTAQTPADILALADFAGSWAQDLVVLDDAATARWQQAAADLLARVDAFAAADHPGLELLTPQSLSLPVEELHAAATKACSSSWFGRKKRQLAVVSKFDAVLRPGAQIPRKQIAEVTGRLVAVQKEIRSLTAAVSAVDGLQVPPDWNPLLVDGRKSLADQVRWLAWAGPAASLRDDTGRLLDSPTPFRVGLRRFLESRSTASEDDRTALRSIADAFGSLRSRSASPDEAFGRWAGEPGLIRRWQSTAAQRRLDENGVPTLRRWLALLAHLQPFRKAGAEAARRLLLGGQIPAAEAARSFDAGVAAASMIERGNATGLDAFEPTAQDRHVQRFTTATEQIRSQLVTSIPANILQRRGFDPTTGYGQIGELQRELSKQRRGLQVRALMVRYGELIGQIMPCILVSPDSLSRFFPPRADLFDIVVFDEASQIRVADAVGALGRARSAVVVGDSKQMPPTSFAEPSFAEPSFSGPSSGRRADSAPCPDGGIDDDRDDNGDSDSDSVEDLLAVQDEESILSECVQARVPRKWLSWHYRSQDEALIAFSNRHYYENKLSSFPSPTSGHADSGPAGHGISLVRVDGRFLRSGGGRLLRTNPIEAVAVVTEIRKRFAFSPDQVPSIGVVTFNAQQRTHVEALLRDLADERITDALDRGDGEGLFVKNLENVQGDERDVILFSTAFSANERGVLPLNFGPLNRAGGERRLNVAITRARRQVIVFSSFDPADLRSEETSSQGIKDLREYLDLAQLGTDSVLGSSRTAPATDRHREEIAAALRTQGLSVRTCVGLSEFTVDLVVGPVGADPVAAVLLDGPGWAARRTVGDRDGLPVQVLSELMRWPAVERVWLPEWLTQPGQVLDRLAAHASQPPGHSGRALAVADRAEPTDAAERTARDQTARDQTDRSATTDTTDTTDTVDTVDTVDTTGSVETADTTDTASSFDSADGADGGDGAVGPDGADDLGRADRAGTAGTAGIAPTSDGTSLTPPRPAAIDRMITAPIPPSITAAPTLPSALSTRWAPEATERPALPGEIPFAPWISGYLGGRDVLDRLPHGSAAARVSRALAAGIEAEGPIHLDRLVKLVAAGFDLGRLSPDRKAAILDCLPDGVLRDPADQAFGWSSSLGPLDWNGFRRTGPDADRPLDHVAPREIGNAMVALCVAGAGMAEDQLYAETLRVFGFRRRTSAQLRVLDAALQAAVFTGRLQRNPGGLITATVTE